MKAIVFNRLAALGRASSVPPLVSASSKQPASRLAPLVTSPASSLATAHSLRSAPSPSSPPLQAHPQLDSIRQGFAGTALTSGRSSLLSSPPGATTLCRGLASGPTQGAESGAARAEGSSGWAAVPRTQKALGLSGIIPFVALSPPIAAVVPLMPVEVVQHAALLQTAYGISIATFLGGIHWGLAMAEFGGKALSSRVAVERYIWSVTPSLLACPAVMLPPMQSSFVIAGTIAAAYMVDSNFASRGMVPKWYVALRLPLTVGALFGMMTTVYHIAYLT